MASDTEYVPVIDDQLLVLYLNRSAHPDLANRYELKHVNPFTANKTEGDTPDDVIDELQRMLSATPNLPDVRLTLTRYLIAQRRFDDAQPQLDILIHWQPMNPSLLFFQGPIAHQKDNDETAISNNARLFEITDERHKIGPLLGECYVRSKDYISAYETFSASINPYRDAENNLSPY